MAILEEPAGDQKRGPGRLSRKPSRRKNERAELGAPATANSDELEHIVTEEEW